LRYGEEEVQEVAAIAHFLQAMEAVEAAVHIMYQLSRLAADKLIL
jgi:hypothetical protein